ncbi:MAG: hypothetical protein HUJ53_10720 [Holdemanella sp.]|nr:hypothetical protein [Holdemanella sp.]
MLMDDLVAILAMKYEGKRKDLIKALDNGEMPTDEEIIRFYRKLLYGYVFYMDYDFPEIIRDEENSPLLIFCKGDLRLLDRDGAIIQVTENENGVKSYECVIPMVRGECIYANSLVASESHDELTGVIERLEKKIDKVMKGAEPEDDYLLPLYEALHPYEAKRSKELEDEFDA